MATKYLKGLAGLWAVWIFCSSSVVITRFQFASGISNLFGIKNPDAILVLQRMWWIVDRAYHVLEFTILSALLLQGFQLFQRRPFLLLPTILACGALDELHQAIVNFPAGHTYDVFIDTIGACIALWVYVRTQIKQDTLAASVI